MEENIIPGQKIKDKSDVDVDVDFDIVNSGGSSLPKGEGWVRKNKSMMGKKALGLGGGGKKVSIRAAR